MAEQQDKDRSSGEASSSSSNNIASNGGNEARPSNTSNGHDGSLRGFWNEQDSSVAGHLEMRKGAEVQKRGETADYIGFRPIYEGSRIDRKELVRLTLQSLRELGYDESAKTLESEAGVSLEHPSILAFRAAVLEGDWRNAERLLVDGLTYAAVRGVSSKPSPPSDGAITSPDLSSVLRDPATQSIDSIKFLLQQQRYLELLEAGQTKKALSVLRDRLTPLSHGSQRLHLLSSLVMGSSVSELKSKAEWDGAGISSRRKLLQEIEHSISPDIMLPSRRLPSLLEQARTLQKYLDPFFNLPQDYHVSLYIDHRSDRSIFPSQTSHILRGHDDEVWVMAFSHNGNYLATGSKDKTIVIWSITCKHCEKVKTLGPHSSEISTLSWSPDDRTILSASDTDVYLWHWESDDFEVLNEHRYSVYASGWLPSGQGFITGGTDGQVIFWDSAGLVTHVWTTSPFRVLGLAITPDGKYLVAVSWRPTDSGLFQSTSVNGFDSNGASSGNVQRASSTATTTTSSSLNSSYSPSESPSPVSTSGHYAEASGSGRSEGRRGIEGLSKQGRRPMLLSDDDRSKIHVFDIAKQQEDEGILLSEEMMSVTVSSDSRFLLINQRPDEAQLWDIKERSLVSTYVGHSVGRDMIRCCFGGSEESFVATGSEDSVVYVYHRNTGKLLIRLEGHGPGSVNTVAWHPKLPSLLASCGDDGTVRIWQPAPKAGTNSSSGGTAAGAVDEATSTSHDGAASQRSSGVSTVAKAAMPKVRRFGNPRSAAAREQRVSGGADARESTGQMPFPWSMSPARPATPEDDTLVASLEMDPLDRGVPSLETL